MRSPKVEHTETIRSLIDALVTEKMRVTGKPKWDATAMVMRERPDLRKALVDATNAQAQKR
jgi:hypothetical protein